MLVLLTPRERFLKSVTEKMFGLDHTNSFFIVPSGVEKWWHQLFICICSKFSSKTSCEISFFSYFCLHFKIILNYVLNVIDLKL